MVNFLQLKHWLLTTALLLATVSSFAYDFAVGNFYYTKLSENTVILTCDKYDGVYEQVGGGSYKYSNSMRKFSGAVTIPSTVSNGKSSYLVVAIDDAVFQGCKDLISVTIPDGLTSIGNATFDGCRSLTTINIPDGVTSMGIQAFSDCSSLTSINIPNGLKSIPDFAYSGCSSLTSINIPNNVTSIGYSAFLGCSGLTSLTIPNGVTSIGQNVIKDCSNLASIIIGDGVSSIAGFDFTNLKKLISVVIGNGVTSIGDNAFLGCSSLVSITIGNRVSTIGSYSFKDCSGLTSINIPDGVTSIGNYAFSYCCGLTSINIPQEVSSIGNNTFEHCSGLTSINIPSKVTSIGNNAFYGCTRLTSINIPNEVTSIGENAFSRCISLTSINIPIKVTSIGENAFSQCQELKDVNISSIEQWMKIKNYNVGLSNYSLVINGLKLTDLVIPKNFTTIGNYAFYGCTGLESITIHKDITAIVQNALNGCLNVKKIVCQGETPPACGTNALEGISRTECTLYVPETSGNNYKNTAPWNEFSNIVGGGTDTPDTPKTCEAPTITFDNETKKLVFTSSTEGAKCHYSVSSEDFTSKKTANEATMTGVYTITVYASADGMYNSEKTTVKLCWVSAEIESDGILNAKADRGVIVSSNGGSITISGTKDGETIEIYSTGGSKLKSVKASSNETVIGGLNSGSVYIVKIGGTKVKVAM